MFVFGAFDESVSSMVSACTGTAGSAAAAPVADAIRRMSRRVMDAITADSTTFGNVLHNKSLLVEDRLSRLRITEPKKHRNPHKCVATLQSGLQEIAPTDSNLRLPA